MRSNNAIRNAAIALSIITSIVAIYYGISAFFYKAPFIAALALISYGVLSSALLFSAWKYKAELYKNISFIVALLLSLFIVIGSFDYGIISSLEWILILILVPAVFVNWLAIKLIVNNHRLTSTSSRPTGT
jgi:hypothetical protein